MPSLPYVNDAVRRNDRADIAVLPRDFREGSVDIDLGDDSRGVLDPRDIFPDLIADGTVKLVLQCPETVFRAKDLVLKLLETRHGVALSADEGLLSRIGIRDLVLKGIRHFDDIPENSVVFYFERTDPGLRLLLGFKIHEPCFALGPCASVRVHLLVVVVTDDSALLHRERRIVDDRAPDQIAEIFQRIKILVK